MKDLYSNCETKRFYQGRCHENRLDKGRSEMKSVHMIYYKTQSI